MPANNSHTGRKLFSSYTINVLFTMFALVGMALVSRLTVKLNPGRQANSLYISYSFANAAPQVVEQQVTSVLEGAFATIPGINHIESNSSQGFGNITLEAARSADLQTLRFQVLSVIKDVWQHLPDEVGYPEISNGRGSSEGKQLLLSYVLNGNAGSYELQQYAEQFIKPRFAATYGINGIEVYGATPFEWHYIYNQALLTQYGLTVHDLQKGLYAWHEIQGIGTTHNQALSESGKQYPVSLSTTMADEKWENLPLKNLNGNIIRLGDVAQREIVAQPPTSYFRINGQNTITINVYAETASNQIKVADRIYAMEKQLSKSLPKKWSLIKMYDSSEYLRREINKTSYRLLIAIVLLLLFVLLIHRSFRYLLLIMISLIVNLAISIILFYLAGVEIHLVSIAGITVSIGIIIDNYIMMTDYMLQRRNSRIFTAMLGATLTTLGALVVIFFLDEADRTNLIDFALVVIINLSVSLLVALLLIPSLMHGLNIRKRATYERVKRLKRVLKFNRIYEKYIGFALRFRWAFIILAILAFGIPLQLLPTSVDRKTPGSGLYNSTFGSNFYNNYLRSVAEKYLGGTLRLFMLHAGSSKQFYAPRGETTLYMRVSLPTGTTIGQLNSVCLKLESYLKQFPEIRQFQTSVNGPQDAQIIIYFTPEALKGAGPQQIKGFMIQKANEFAGADFGIYMRNESFSNELSEGWRMSQIRLSGYNYRELIALAHHAADSLKSNPRISNIALFSGTSYYNQDATIEEKELQIDKGRLVASGATYLDFVEQLKLHTSGPVARNVIMYNGDYLTVKLFDSYMPRYDIWQVMNNRMQVDNTLIVPGEISEIKSNRVDGNIYRKDQSYFITVAYDFIGPDELARRVLERETAKLNQMLPMGYKAEVPDYSYLWKFGEKPVQYWLLGLIVLIILAISAIVFESLIQPLVVISMIPLSFIGTFITFLYFDIPFDEGGYASLLLLSGLVVNMIIYILNDVNHLRLQSKVKGSTLYLKAFNMKILPIVLTTLSTLLGLLPFMVIDSHTSFWTAFAAGTTGGLLFAIPVLMLYLPFMVRMEITSLNNKGDSYKVKKRFKTNIA